MSTPDLMIRVRTGSETLTKWIWRVANSHLGRKYMQSNAMGTAGAMPKINGGILRDLPVPLPPYPEMAELLAIIAESVDAADDFERQLASFQKALRALRQSILQAAFEGRLVPQDPTDEPASVLLARLRKESVGAYASRGRRGRKRDRLETPGLPLFAVRGDHSAADPG